MLGKHSASCATSTAQNGEFLEDPREGSEIQNSRQPLDSSWVQLLILVFLKDFSETPIFTDTVVFRVAPWIMTPSTLPPLEVYVCR